VKPPSGRTYFHHEHPDVAFRFLQVGVVDLAEPAAEHDGFDPLPPFAVLQPLAEGTAVPRDEGFAELVPVIAGAVAGVHQDLQRFRQVAGVLEILHCRFQFETHVVTFHLKVTNAVPRGTRGEQRTGASGVRVPHAAARPGLCARVRRHA
jgi:hypothetical protein